MTSQAYLTDMQIADVLNYIKNSWAINYLVILTLQWLKLIETNNPIKHQQSLT